MAKADDLCTLGRRGFYPGRVRVFGVVDLVRRLVAMHLRVVAAVGIVVIAAVVALENQLLLVPVHVAVVVAVVSYLLASLRVNSFLELLCCLRHLFYFYSYEI